MKYFFIGFPLRCISRKDGPHMYDLISSEKTDEVHRRTIMNTVVCFILFRVFLPLSLIASIVFRYNGMSLVYLLLLMVGPLVPPPTSQTMLGSTGNYLKSLVAICFLLAIGHLSFQVVLLSHHPYGNFLNSCDSLETILRQSGFVKYNDLDVLNVTRHVAPEMLMIIVSVILYSICRKLIITVDNDGEPQVAIDRQTSQTASPLFRHQQRKNKKIVAALGSFLDLLLFAAAGIMHPSIISSVYFLVFLAVATWIACYQQLGTGFRVLRILLLILSALHLIALYLYQFPFMQELVPPGTLYPRLVGLTDLVLTDCDDPRKIYFSDKMWDQFVNPAVLFVLYWVLAVQTRLWLSSRFSSKTESAETAPLLDGDRAVQTYHAMEGSDAQQTRLELDPNGSAVFSADVTNPPQPAATDGFSKLRNLLSPIISIFQLITRQSYIATLIIMMAWSITYHSWLTFILLLWSCILWMMPNSRQACWRTSPLLVLYAEVLLLIQYVYSLNLTQEELPQTVDQVNLGQIGLKHEQDPQCKHLTVKIMYTVMFFITLRQYMQERFKERNKDIAEGVMMQPFNMAYATTAQTERSHQALQRQQSIPPPTSPLMKTMGDFVHGLLTKYWIWVVALMLMLNGLTGKDVVVFRIIYMALFLFFVLMFQISYRIWRVIMYGFWLTVIMYSMTLLILIYTYQFEFFPNYWAKYLYINKELQQDIGLEVYDTGGLFINLLRATFFVIITIIQLHYFHKDFLRISDIEREKSLQVYSLPIETEPTGYEPPPPLSSAPPAPPIAKKETQPEPPADSQSPLAAGKDDLPLAATKHVKSEHDVKDIFLTLWNKYWTLAMKVYDNVSEVCWRYLEIHVIKIVMFSVLLLALYDVCAIHFVFVIFVMVALPFHKLQTFLSHCAAVWASVLLISKMIYQIDYINEYWMVNCTDAGFNNSYPFNETINNAEWVGFMKKDNLSLYVRGYLGLMFILTIQAVVKVRMRHNRKVNNIPVPKRGIMFPEVTHLQADVGLAECIKYLVNYSFYKFGMEICLITICAGVGVRLDVFALIYAIWLAILFLLRRTTLRRVWPLYVGFLTIVIPIEYILCVGMPPGLCLRYFYDGEIDPELREWLYWPDFAHRLPAYKLTVDFFLLLFACCQLQVFSIESRDDAEEYEGGSNAEIILIPDYHKNNPKADYVTYTRSYLDLAKVIIFFSLYWVTLAIFFLAGTNRVSIFAMGYVISCFLFLWTGQEYFLKPMSYILKWWNVLLSYTVGVIFIKSILQVIGCVFLKDLQANFCWLIQLFGIACLKKFHKPSTSIPGTSEDLCQAPTDEAGLMWDGICLAFLLLQKRFFCSYYYLHLVMEMRAQGCLANRGAELINHLLMKEVMEQQAAEKEIVEKIRKKMDKIRTHQQKIRGDEYVEPNNHFSAIRSGDYYLFEDFSDDEGLAELEHRSPKKNLTDDADEVPVKGIPVTQLLASAMKTDIKQAVTAAKQAKVSEAEGQAGVEQVPAGDRPGRTPVSRTVSGASQVSFDVRRQDSLSPRDIPRRHSLHPIDDVRAATLAGESGSDEQPTSSISVPGEMAKDKPDSDAKKYEEIKEESIVDDSTWLKIQNWCRFAWVFVEGLMVSATQKLNHFSRDYRYVSRSLNREKKALKEQWMQNETEFDFGTPSAAGVMAPGSAPRKSADSAFEIRVEKPSEDKSDESIIVIETPEISEKEFEADQPPIVRLLVALWYALVSHSEIVCYIMVVVNQIKSASILSLPLPFMSFLWGSLSMPRPSKSFWITIITYTEAIVVIKYMFQFGFFPWNQDSRGSMYPFWPPKIMGIEKKEQYALYDLALLLVVFFHRFILKSLGLWKDTSKYDEPTSSSSKLDLNTLGSVKSSAGSTSSKATLTVSQKVETDQPPRAGPGGVLMGFLQYINPIRSFFFSLLHPSYRVTKDVYTFMFICDFTTFLIVVFGYAAFGTGGGDDGVASYFEENKVPVPFLVMLIAQFGLIVVDRALFLRKHILGKIVFQIMMVFVVHMWMFFVLPSMTERPFNSSLAPQLWYFVKCMYLLLSAYQIRSGYPTRILGNFLTKKYNYANLFLFKGFMAVPFLFELRALMDWIWTETSMSIGSWLKMEDIFAHIFLLKCWRRSEAEYPVPRGQNRKAIVKYGVGGLLLFVIIFIIWFPLVLFALSNAVGVPNPPTSCTIEITIAGYEPIFKMSVQQNALHQFTKQEYESLEYRYRTDSRKQQFLANYGHHDIFVAKLNGSSTSIWTISPPGQLALAEELQGNYSMTLTFSWQVSHVVTGKQADPTVGGEYNKELLPKDPVRMELARMITAPTILAPLSDVQQFLPKFIRVPGKGKASVVERLLPSPQYYTDMQLKLKKGVYLNSDTDIKFWWEVKEGECNGEECYNWLPEYDQYSINIVLFNDKVFPATLSIISGYGIIGLYTTLVLVASRFVRGMFAGVSFTIMFDDMPNVDRVLQLCLDIYLVRESGELKLEEDLFAKLLFLYRSPETLIKWTRYPTPGDQQPQQ